VRGQRGGINVTGLLLRKERSNELATHWRNFPNHGPVVYGFPILFLSVKGVWASYEFSLSYVSILLSVFFFFFSSTLKTAGVFSWITGDGDRLRIGLFER